MTDVSGDPGGDQKAQHAGAPRPPGQAHEDRGHTDVRPLPLHGGEDFDEVRFSSGFYGGNDGESSLELGFSSE